MFIAVLEDDERRQNAMREILSRFAAFEVVMFDNAPQMIEWLPNHLTQIKLLCLDHDLGPNRRTASGDVFDPGIGRDVADFLAECVPVCPIVIHTTNYIAAPGMLSVLEAAGWNVSRVVPYSDLQWLHEAWADKVMECLDADERVS